MTRSADVIAAELPERGELIAYTRISTSADRDRFAVIYRIRHRGTYVATVERGAGTEAADLIVDPTYNNVNAALNARANDERELTELARAAGFRA